MTPLISNLLIALLQESEEVYWLLSDKTKGKITENISTVTKLNNNPKLGAVLKSGENKWGLRSRDWNLRKAAADYYLLQLLVMVDADRYTVYLDKHSSILVDQFARYTDMAIGGEIRHIGNKSGIAKRLKEAIGDGTVYGSRNSAWEGWYWFRQQYGTVALKWLVESYNDTSRWKPGYGGTAWGTIANTLLLFERGEITPHSFIDTCFGLQHNGGVYFNKWWNVEYIQTVLDRNQSGRYCELMWDASHMIKQLVPNSVIKDLCLCGIHSGD